MDEIRQIIEKTLLKPMLNWEEEKADILLAIVKEWANIRNIIDNAPIKGVYNKRR